MDRRSFLLQASGLAASAALTGCSSSPTTSLKVRLLRGSVPAQLPGLFQKSLKATPVTLDFKPEAQIQKLFSLLQTWKQQSQAPRSSGFSLPFSVPLVYDKSAAIVPDLVTLGDAWLAIAIRQGLIQPLAPTNSTTWSQWQQVPADWRSIVTRNDQGELAANGKIWGAPYRWGTTVIAYNREIFAQKNLQPPTDWADLWRPELRGHISLLDQPREVIGLTLKKLGASYNTADLTAIKNLTRELQSLHQQVKFYSSDHYLQPLILGDTWVAVGWSTDVLITMRQQPKIAAVVPASGTALWADLWVRPATATHTQPEDLAVLAQWLDFCWQPTTATQLSVLSQAASPILVNHPPSPLPQEISSNPILLPPAATLQHSEFLAPLSPTTTGQYQSQWENLRQKR
jgi:putative spermidine/putrescine transport system substrate-binding protein